MSETGVKTYETNLKNRELLTLNGVKNVDSFGEDYLTLSTELGEVTVEGSSLKIDSLTKENGEILIRGNISGIFYKDEKTEKGFFRKLFK